VREVCAKARATERLPFGIFGRQPRPHTGLVDVGLAHRELEVSFATANKLVESLSQLGLLSEVTGRKRDRIFRFAPYLALFEGDEDSPA